MEYIRNMIMIFGLTFCITKKREITHTRLKIGSVKLVVVSRRSPAPSAPDYWGNKTTPFLNRAVNEKGVLVMFPLSLFFYTTRCAGSSDHRRCFNRLTESCSVSVPFPSFSVISVSDAILLSISEMRALLVSTEAIIS